MSTNPSNSSANQRVISAEHLKLVLIAHRARKAGIQVSRFAAVSDHLRTTARCDTRDHGRAHAVIKAPPLLYPLIPSVLPSLVDRVKLTYGLPEVQRTWGTNYKRLMQELS